jgi:hypothetical protein
MTRLATLTALLLALALAPAADARIVPGKGMAGITMGMTEAQVKAVLGAPDSRKTLSDDFGPYLRLRYTSHGGLRLTMRDDASGAPVLFSVTTEGKAERTKEGIGVGSSRKRLRAKLSGEKCERLGSFRHCSLGSFKVGRIVTDFRLNKQLRVVSVVVGRVVD